MHRKATRKRLVRYGLVAGNALILGIVTAFILQTPQAGGVQSSAILSNQSQASGEVAGNPLDQVSSADIALTVARMSSLPESTAITNQAESQAVTMTHASATATVVSKPQVVTTELKSSADIQTVTAAAGDTVSSLAQKYGVTSDSIRWSNNLSGDTVNAGTKLLIPPVNGFVYTVQAGDSVDSLASKFSASRDKIIAFNDAEISGLKPGSQIMIPDGSKATAMPRTAAAIARSGAIQTTSFPWGGAPVYGYNGYDYGYCTWYAASRVPVPSNWGNANTWDNLAASSGWTVSSVPRVGAVGQSDAGYYGHVAVVEAVSEDGSRIKYSDMNGLAGFGRVGYSDWVPVSKFPKYIYR
jgi:N-acetylmuramoyl-L-alanine amidase